MGQGPVYPRPYRPRELLRQARRLLLALLIASNSTRRLLCRPSGVSFEATGFDFSFPIALRRDGAMPASEVRYCLTASARC